LRKSFPATELAEALGSAPARWGDVIGCGYGSNTRRWRVALEDGRAVFVKMALDELAAGWLRDEHLVYSEVEASYLPELVGWHDSEQRTLLVIEDLSAAHWPPPWSQPQIDSARRTLEMVHGTAPPAGLPRLEELREWLNGWELVAADPEPLLSSGLCTAEWLEVALPSLRAASAECLLDGDAFLHFDFRSDNLCFSDGRVVLVDWNLACVGNPDIDLVAWLPSLRLEGGPEPWEVVPDSGGLAALICGFFASRAGLPVPDTAPRVREFQRGQAEVALPWVARELGLTLPS
jgi:phosphotransferase family enzyme